MVFERIIKYKNIFCKILWKEIEIKDKNENQIKIIFGTFIDLNISESFLLQRILDKNNAKLIFWTSTN